MSESGERIYMDYRLKTTARGLRSLGAVLKRDMETTTENGEVDKIFLKLTEILCAPCEKNKICWEQEYMDTCHAMYGWIQNAWRSGICERVKMPITFRKRCVYMDKFLQEARFQIWIQGLQCQWQCRLNECYLILAEQMERVADLVDDLSERESTDEKLQEQWTRRIMRTLKSKHLYVKFIHITEEAYADRKRHLYIFLRAVGKNSTLVSHVAQWVSEATGGTFVPKTEGRKTIGSKYGMIELVEDVKYQLVQGMVSEPKSKQGVNGDLSSFLYLESGQVLMILSDGMGTGEEAMMESEMLMLLLEKMMDTGVHKKTVLRMINSILYMKNKNHGFSSLDLAVVDLFSGKCEFLKVGAASTFIKSGEKVDCVTSGSLPMGVFPELDYEMMCRNLFDGDMIIMVSDGIINQFSQGEDTVCQILSEIKSTNPKQVAEHLFHQSKESVESLSEDDRTVMVGYICKKRIPVV